MARMTAASGREPEHFNLIRSDNERMQVDATQESHFTEAAAFVLMREPYDKRGCDLGEKVERGPYNGPVDAELIKVKRLIHTAAKTGVGESLKIEHGGHICGALPQRLVHIDFTSDPMQQ